MISLVNILTCSHLHNKLWGSGGSNQMLLQSFIPILHTSDQTIFKCINKHNLIKIYHVVQELEAFSQTGHNWPGGCWQKPRFAYQCLGNVEIY